MVGYFVPQEFFPLGEMPLQGQKQNQPQGAADNGHEFPVKFHWHLEDQDIRHTYIKLRTPRLNGKVERSHGTDQREFYQLDDIDLNAKLAEWEAFYNYHSPHGKLGWQTPYERLIEKMR